MKFTAFQGNKAIASDFSHSRPCLTRQSHLVLVTKLITTTPPLNLLKALIREKNAKRARSIQQACHRQRYKITVYRIPFYAF